MRRVLGHRHFGGRVGGGGWHRLSHAEGELFTRCLKSSRRVESTSTRKTGGADGFPRLPDRVHVVRINAPFRARSPVRGFKKKEKDFS